MANQCKPVFTSVASRAFISLDFIFSLVPIMLMVAYILSFASLMEQRAQQNLDNQVLFDKLVSASNYVVRIAAAQSEGSGFPEKAIHPNIIYYEDFSSLEKIMMDSFHLNSLRISFSQPDGMCIYRLVVYEPTGEIKKLYFCGD